MLSTHQLRNLRRRQLPRSGNKIALAFELSGTKARDLVKTTGLRAQYVSDVKCGRVRNLSVHNARRFAEFFGCGVEDLFPAPPEVSV